MTELTELGVAAIRDGVPRRRLHRARGGRGVQRRGRRGAGRSTPSSSRRPRMRSPPPTRPTRRARRASAEPLAGVPLGIKDLFATKGVADHRRQPHPRRLQADLRKHRHRSKLCGRRRGHARQAQHGRVRHGLVERDQRLRPGDLALAAQRRRQCRADAGRLLGRLGRRRSRRGSRPAATGTDTGGSIRQPAAFTGICGHQADLRPLLALGHRRLRLARSTRPGRWRATCATARSCSRRWPASTRRIRPRSTCRCPQWEADLSSDLKGKRVGIPKEYRIDGVPAEIDALWDAGHRLAEGCRRRDRRDQPAAHQICAADLLHHRPGRGLVQPRPL